MRYARYPFVAGLLAAASLLSAPAWAINKCVDAQGRTSFQDEPCAAGQKGETITLTPSSQGVNPRENSRPVTSSPPVAAPPSASAPQADAPEPRPADCPDPERMKTMQIEAESIALPLPIRKQKRASFEELKARCGG
ncbi:MAG: DUF4124 domain-containing protein [Comamonas sp.]